MITIPRNELLALTKAHGLPLFVYDADFISKQIALLRSSFAPFIPEIHYACKALNTIGILQHINQQGCGVDAVSPGEIEMALRAGIPQHQISFTPSGVLYDEYAFAIERGIHIHVDQLHVLHWLAKEYPGTKVTLRFNPGVQAGGHKKLQVGAAGSKFGILADQVAEVKKLTDAVAIEVTGVHMHLGSDIGESDSFSKAYAYLLEIALHWKDTIDHVDLGGGFKVPYHPGDHAINMQQFGAEVASRFDQFCNAIGKQVKLVLEPGKFLVSQAGYLLMEVTGVREAGETDMVYVQSGFNHFLRPMNYEAYHHIVNLSAKADAVNTYDIVGNLCETDTFALGRTIEVVTTGDVLCLCNAGAYGYTMSSNYNGRPRPAEVLWKNDRGTLIRRAETIEDLLNTDLGNARK